MFRKSQKTQRTPEKAEGVNRQEKSWSEENIREIMRSEIKMGLKEARREENSDFREMMDEMKGMMREMRKMREDWEREREKDRRAWKEIEEKIKKMELEGKEKEEKMEKRIEEIEKERGNESETKEGRELEKRIKEIEMKWERKEREMRRRNIIIKGIEMRDGGDGKEEVKKLLDTIGEKVEIEEIRRRGGKGVGQGEWAVVRIATEEQKRRITREKKRLAGRKERIDDDLTWEERSVQWRIKQMMEKEKGKGKTVKIGYMKAWIDGKLWRWNERENVLKDGEGNEWGEIDKERGK